MTQRGQHNDRSAYGGEGKGEKKMDGQLEVDDIERIEITTDDARRVLYRLSDRQIICPTCGSDDLYINNNKHYQFCPMCGQRLEWWVGTVSDDELDTD